LQKVCSSERRKLSKTVGPGLRLLKVPVFLAYWKYNVKKISSGKNIVFYHNEIKQSASYPPFLAVGIEPFPCTGRTEIGIMNILSGNPQVLKLMTIGEGKVQLPLRHLRSAQWSANEKITCQKPPCGEGSGEAALFATYLSCQ